MLVYMRKNIIYLNSIKLFIEIIGLFILLLDFNILLKYFSDFINFFNSFNFFFDKKLILYFSIEGNSYGNNIFKNGIRNCIVLENLFKFLDFVYIKKMSGNNMSKSLKLGKVYFYFDYNFIVG